MLALIVYLLFAATEPAASPAPPVVPAATNTVSGVTVQAPSKEKPPAPDLKIDMQSDDEDVDQRVVIWPATAYQGRLDGRVRLRCNFDAHGLAETCVITSEDPEGKGFGSAALEMRPTFKIAPAMGPDGPIAATKIVSIRFKAPDTRFDQAAFANATSKLATSPKRAVDMGDFMFGIQNGLASRRVTMLDHPVWTQAANFDDLARVYPAKGGGVEGYAVDHCMVKSSGALFNCEVIKEEPEGRGFDKAALALASRFKVAPALAATHHSSQLWVDISIRLPPPDKLADRTVMAPVWLLGVDPYAIPKIFPPEAVAQGLVTGRGVTRCTIAADGAMSSCAPEAGQPDGLGFSEAATKLASRMKMNLWSADGAPVAGGVVHIPIRLNLKDGG